MLVLMLAREITNKGENMYKIQKPDGLSPEESKFWDENVQTMQAIIRLYISCAKSENYEGFKILNFFIATCSQIAAGYLNDALDGPTQ
jgi:hypothetical protein